MTIGVLVVEDDFHVAQIHRALAQQIDGFTVLATAASAAEATALAAKLRPDIALVDNYLPDRPGIELAAELTCDVIMVTADRAADSVRAAMNAGALNYIVKPFVPDLLMSRLAAYARYRGMVDPPCGELEQAAVDRAMRALHEADQQHAPKGQSPVTAQLVASALRTAQTPLTAAEVAHQLGIGRGTAQRYLSALTQQDHASMTLRYGATGRPEHLYVYHHARGRGGHSRP